MVVRGWREEEMGSYCLISIEVEGQGLWLTPVIPALWEAEVGRWPGLEIKPILANMVKPHL